MEDELWILVRLIVAVALGGVIGFEREHTGKNAGLRTHMLVALGSALFMSFLDVLADEARPLAPPGEVGNFRVQIEPMAVVTAIVTGISFLGAGTIFVGGRRERVRGLTTAASVWVTAAVGIAVGLERYLLATGATLLVLGILRLAVLLEPRRDRQGRAVDEEGELRQ
jgi:putative Mg2+ transporter-C (MgtC) family protein